MTLGLLSGEVAEAAGDDPCGLVTTGGTGSILHAILAYREHAAQTRGVTRPNVIKPETAHPAFDKACHLFGVELRRAPGRPGHHAGRRRLGARPHRRRDGRPDRLGLQLRLRHRRPDQRPVRPGARAGHRPARRRLPRRLHPPLRPASSATTSPSSTTRVPGVTSHVGRHPQVRLRLQGLVGLLSFRTKALRNAQYFYLTDWSGGKYTSPGMEGSRSGGLIAATWAVDGPARPRRLPGLRTRRSSRRRSPCRTPCGRTPSCAWSATRPSCFSFTSDEFDIYHVNDFMRTPRLALQRPAVPQRPAHGRDAAPDPARGGRRSSPPTWPTPSPTPRSTPPKRRSRAPSTAGSPAA